MVSNSNSISIPVLVGEAAAIFNPKRVDDGQRALEAACLDKYTRVKLLFASNDRLRLFNSDLCAREMSAAYCRAVSG